MKAKNIIPLRLATHWRGYKPLRPGFKSLSDTEQKNNINGMTIITDYHKFKGHIVIENPDVKIKDHRTIIGSLTSRSEHKKCPLETIELSKTKFNVKRTPIYECATNTCFIKEECVVLHKEATKFLNTTCKSQLDDYGDKLCEPFIKDGFIKKYEPNDT
jgi:hypothetical protein